jgi:hypothetical protein
MKVKRNDKKVRFRGTLKDNGELVPSLTQADSITFICRNKDSSPDGAPDFSGAATVLDVDESTVVYVTADEDLAERQPGLYQVEWEVVWPTGERETYPSGTWDELEILADLNPA